MDKYRFDGRPLDEQLVELCRDANLDFEDGQGYVLMRSLNADIFVFNSTAQLLGLPADTPISLEKVDELVRQRLAAVHQATAETCDASLHALLGLLSNERAAAEAIEQDAAGVLARAAAASFGPYCTELSMLCFCSLLEANTEEVLEWVQRHWQECGAELCANLLSTAFPDEEDEFADAEAPRACLAALLLLLQSVDGAVASVHASAVYTGIVEAETSDDSGAFLRNAARLVLYQLLKDSEDEASDAALRREIRAAVMEAASKADEIEDTVAWIDGILKDGCEAAMFLTLGCCGDGAREADLQWMQAEVLSLRKELEKERSFARRLRGELRRGHRAMCAMLPFLTVESQRIRQSLDSIVRSGWEALPWKDEHTLLHHVCETCVEPGLVDLVALLCTDFDAKDSKGFTALDYAQENPEAAIAELVERRSREFTQSQSRSGVQTAPEDTSSPAPPAAARSALDAAAPQALPSLRKESSDETAAGASVQMKTSMREGMLKVLLQKREAEKLKLEEELRVLRSHGPPADATLGASGGPLSEKQLSELYPEFAQDGRDRLLQRLQESDLVDGGLGLSQVDALKLIGQLELINRVATSSPSAAAAPPAAATGSPAKGQEKGKGKGKAPPPAAPKGEGKGSPAAATGKGELPAKGKGKSPPPPSGKGVPPLAPGGKGSPPAAPSGKGGPPAPGSKGEKGKGGKGKGKAVAVEPTKTSVTPGEDMKSLQWTRLVNGTPQLPKDEATIWDAVNKDYAKRLEILPAAELEERFSKNAGRQKVEKVETQKVEKPKILQIAGVDSSARFNIEVILKGLPPALSTPEKARLAIENLDSDALGAENMKTLGKYLCPDSTQAEQLVAKRQELPDLPWDKIEAYMDELRVIAVCKQRLTCWQFLLTAPEQRVMHQSNVRMFEAMVKCFRECDELPKLLGLVLAFGNFLNGGKSEKRLGQADGFHVETLGRPGGLDVLRDPQGKNIRQLLFKTYIQSDPDRAAKLLQDLAPCLALVSRVMAKGGDEDGGGGQEKLRKDVRIQIEDIDKQVTAFKGEFDTRSRELKDALQQIKDPSDRFKMEMPKLYEDERKQAEQLVLDTKRAKDSFQDLLKHYKAEKFKGPKGMEDMTSEVWVMLWDDFLVVKELIENRTDTIKKETMIPRFCKTGVPLDLESLEILWELKDPGKPVSKKKSVKGEAATKTTSMRKPRTSGGRRPGETAEVRNQSARTGMAMGKTRSRAARGVQGRMARGSGGSGAGRKLRAAARGDPASRLEVPTFALGTPRLDENGAPLTARSNHTTGDDDGHVRATAASRLAATFRPVTEVVQRAAAAPGNLIRGHGRRAPAGDEAPESDGAELTSSAQATPTAA